MCYTEPLESNAINLSEHALLVIGFLDDEVPRLEIKIWEARAAKLFQTCMSENYSGNYIYCIVLLGEAF